MKITQHLLISGRVQGVSFRFYTQGCANRMNITGWVRNLSDGRVEAVAQGLPEKLEELRKLLMAGPNGADVRGIEVHAIAHKEDMKEFKINENGEKPCLKK